MCKQADNERTQSELFALRALVEQESAAGSADADEASQELERARAQVRHALLAVSCERATLRCDNILAGKTNMEQAMWGENGLWFGQKMAS